MSSTGRDGIAAALPLAGLLRGGCLFAALRALLGLLDGRGLLRRRFRRDLRGLLRRRFLTHGLCILLIQPSASRTVRLCWVAARIVPKQLCKQNTRKIKVQNRTLILFDFTVNAG